MLYIFLGVTEEAAFSWMGEKVLPIMRSYGIIHDHNNVVALGSVMDLDSDGNFISNDTLELWFPAFDKLREEGRLEALTVELSTALGFPAFAIDAPIVAAIPGHLLQ